ncbi:hypothetical protein DLAC_11134 [Tieghemostelium lacteum]|uniref:Uncharacterized protein n=1 Tax=Tieghemostelium lacteum TaxID=361077 RepID=A0A151Z399_TIELA|nr:hypothetical protein DLAC_11134 [Tieghemostelium lacteum]|eukprot:KYQ88430.1 hypothetical protein DLAC_11134 [Tieghemostelium lacteum]
MVGLVRGDFQKDCNLDFIIDNVKEEVCMFALDDAIEDFVNQYVLDKMFFNGELENDQAMENYDLNK